MCCAVVQLVKLMKLIDLLVALTVSEEEMYPLIQAYVWTKVGKDVPLLKKVQWFVCFSYCLPFTMWWCTGLAQFHEEGCVQWPGQSEGGGSC